jgi:tRNA (guanine37-N1)-methyltransferase
MSAFNVTLLTLFPEMFPGPLGCSIAGKALNDGLWNLNTVNIRDFAINKHANVDDTPYGGGAGMVMKPDVLAGAIDSVKPKKLVYMSPRGSLFNQAKSRELVEAGDITILCGRYEGVDQRVIDEYNIEEISVGDFILSGGEIAALTVIDTCIRQIDGVLGNTSTLVEESFGDGDFENLLEYPLFTRPPVWRDREVPKELLSGNHKLINEWRLLQAQNLTEVRRKDLWEKHLRNKK